MRRIIPIVIATLILLPACSGEEEMYNGKTAKQWVRLTDDEDPEVRDEAIAALGELYFDSDIAAEKYREIYFEELDLLIAASELWVRDGSEAISFFQICDHYAFVGEMVCSRPQDMVQIADRLRLSMDHNDATQEEADYFYRTVGPRAEFLRNNLPQEEERPSFLDR